jgi:hypothetical protein
LEKLQTLKTEIEKLDNEEQYLDEQIKYMTMNKGFLSDDEINQM